MGTWSLAGNALGTSPTGFLGTTDNNALVIKTGSPTTERLRVDTRGNVGIGTTSPQKPLDVAASGGIRIGQTDEAASTNEIYFADNGQIRSLDENHRIIFNRSGNELEFREYGMITLSPGATQGQRTAKIVVDNGGNVGIGTSTPAATLDVAAGTLHVNEPASPTTITTTVQGAYLAWNALTGSTGETDLINNQGLGTGGFAFMNTPPSGSPRTTLMVITGTGNVGIGTPTPRSMLELSAAPKADAAGPTLTITNATGGLGANVGIAFNTYSPAAGAACSSAISVYDDGNYGNSMSFTTKAPGAANNPLVERLFIASNGNIGIALTEDDERRDNEPASTLVVHGDIRTIGGGNVSVSGDVLLTGADCAEDFDVAGNRSPEPGTVVVIDEGGALSESCDAYDKKVAGVVSGAGDYRHGILLDQRPESEDRVAVALVGKVYCKVDADYSPIDVGDMLTTSLTPGHAMKVMDPAKAFGSVIGKALKALQRGQGMIPILIALQ